MNATSARKVAAPSSNLLRYLRAQNSEVDFFTENHAAKKCLRTRLAPVSRKSQHRSIASSSTETYPLEASLASIFTSAWTRKATRPTTPTSNTTIPHRSSNITSQHLRLPAPPQTRPASTDHTPDKDKSSGRRWNPRFWSRHMRPRTPLEPNDLPDRSGFLDDGLGRALRPANELKLRCTEFDENGNVVLINGEFRKTELIAKYGLLPRDLRKIDSSLLPSILVRPSAILINLLHLRCLIKHNRVLVFDAYGTTDSYTQSLFMYDLEGKLSSPSATSPAFNPSHSLPYEFRALEAVLISVTNGLESEFETVREPVVRVLRELEEDIDRDKLRHLLIYSKKLSSFERKATLVRDAIDDLLEADDDLAAMYLSEKSTSPDGKGREEEDHTEVEMLLESYHKVADEIVQVSGNLVGNIRNTEEVIRAILDANRNSLMLLDLKFSIGTLGLSGGTFVAALYGMNLKNFIEDSDFGFWAISAWCTVFGVTVCLAGLKRLRRVQRLSMFGSGAGGEVKGKGQRAWDVLQKPADPRVVRQHIREAKAKDQALDGYTSPPIGAGRVNGGKRQF